MMFNFKTFVALIGSLVLAASLTAAPADACGWKRAHGGDGAAVQGWKHRKHWKHAKYMK
jgi:hypothetical protein